MVIAKALPGLDPADADAIRDAMKLFSPAPKIEPNETIKLERVFMPDSHRSVLDISRTIIVGNRGAGKSFWTHALLNEEIRTTAAKKYSQPSMATATTYIGFNGSSANLSDVAPTRDELDQLRNERVSLNSIWRAVFFRAAKKMMGQPEGFSLRDTLRGLSGDPMLFAKIMSAADQSLHSEKRNVLLIFDALDRLADHWEGIRDLSKSLLMTALDLKSFRNFRAKIFMRPDQFADRELFAFPDSSKLKNDHVDLKWSAPELYGLLFFEISKDDAGRASLVSVAQRCRASGALDFEDNLRKGALPLEQEEIVASLAGRFMGSDHRKGRVYTWVPLHLGDAHETCSPRTFLTAWRSAANYQPVQKNRAVYHLGLIDGVRKASEERLEELREDYSWIEIPLGALRGKLVPIERSELNDIWEAGDVVRKVTSWAEKNNRLAPVELSSDERNTDSLLAALETIGVMEVRANGKINVPDIFRVKAGIMRKGGVAVPKAGSRARR